LARRQLWFLGAIDCLTNRVAKGTCEDRGSELLVSMICSICVPGCERWSDEWSSYPCLKRHGFVHRTANHTPNYKDPVTGVQTNRVEGNWRALKSFLRIISAKSFSANESYVDESCFRRNAGTRFPGGYNDFLDGPFTIRTMSRLPLNCDGPTLPTGPEGPAKRPQATAQRLQPGNQEGRSVPRLEIVSWSLTDWDIAKQQLPFDRILNAGETSWRVLHNGMRTITNTGLEDVSCDFPCSEKACITVMAAIRRDGTNLPLWVIAKGLTARALKKL